MWTGNDRGNARCPLLAATIYNRQGCADYVKIFATDVANAIHCAPAVTQESRCSDAHLCSKSPWK